MYIYFKLINAVLTCEEYPQILSVDEMKLNAKDNMCNKWEKNDNEDGTFTLSFKYEKELCSCDNSQYVDLNDYTDYPCYECGRPKIQKFKEGDILYLQNSGSIDIVCVKPIELYCKICGVEGHSNIYKWFQPDNDNTRIFILHIKNNMLSDENVSKEIDLLKEYCHIEFMECI